MIHAAGELSRPLRRRRFCRLLLQGLAAATAGIASSCGTILYPERRGQPRGQLDLGVVVLDALGLVFFIIPGLVAFCVDFATGAIYLPPTDYIPVAPVTGRRGGTRPALTRVQVAKHELTRERIEEVVRERTGKPVTLETGKYHARELSDLDEFDEAAERFSDPDHCAPPAHVRFPQTG